MKIFHIFYILSFSFFLNAGYITVPGPLQLIDTVDAQNNKTRGVVIKNLTFKTKFLYDLKKLMAVYNVDDYQKLPCYQQMMLDLDKNILSYQDAVVVITIFETLLMDLVSDELYIMGGYIPYLSNIITGIRYKWVNPFSWMNPFNYYGENNDKVYQLLYELDQLGDIAYKYDSLLATRLKTAAFSYLHWRKVILTGICVLGVVALKQR
jgi:hypothetical protein